MTEDQQRQVQEEARKQVAAVIGEKLSMLRAVATFLIPMLGALVGALGIVQYVSMRDVKKAAGEAEARAAEATKASGQLEMLLAQAEKRLGAVDNLVAARMERLTEDVGNVSKGREAVTGALDDVRELQSRTRLSANDAQASAAELASYKKEFQAWRRDARETHQQVLSRAADVSDLYDKLIGQGGGLKALDVAEKALAETRTELRRLKVSELIALRNGQEVEIRLPNPEPPPKGIEDSKNWYTLHIATKGLNKDMLVRYKVAPPGADAFGDWHDVPVSYKAFKLSTEQLLLPIQGTQFELLVQYMGQGIFIDDFIILRARLRA
jgi:hypothetical protein